MKGRSRSLWLLPYDYRSGTCTTCKQFQLEGEMDQDLAFALDDDEIEWGWRLICIGSPSRMWC